MKTYTRLLILDCYRPSRLFAQKVAEPIFDEIVTATNLAKAKRKMEAEQFTALFFNCDLAGTLPFVRQIAECNKERCYLIGMSTDLFPLRKIEKRFMAAGIDLFLEAPIGINVLREVFQTVVSGELE